MKAIKSLLLVICFLSAFSVAAYAGGGNCYCFRSIAVDGLDYHSNLVWVPSGVTAQWQLEIVLNNEEDYNTAYAYAALRLAIEQHLYEKVAGYTHGPLYFYNPGTTPGSYTNNSGSAAPVYLYCEAQIFGSDTGGGAESQLAVWW